tara:strand:- start:3637 stop:4623 length:987 start_codon:yes stop_codon:yes gene_type:complete
MGYRSYGYFVIPRSAAPELERRVNEYLEQEERKRIEQKAQDELDNGRRMIYTQTKPWNPLSGFDSGDDLEILERDGKEYIKYKFNDWKWYEGYPFPRMVDRIINEINYYDQEEILDSPDFWLETEAVYQGSFGINQKTLVGWAGVADYAAFVRSGEDWNDVEVIDPEGLMSEYMEVDNIPFPGDSFPMTLLMIDTTVYKGGDAEDESLAGTSEWQAFNEKLMALNPTNSTVVDEQHWYQWLGNQSIIPEVREILEEVESTEVGDGMFHGWLAEFHDFMGEYDVLTINDGDMYDYDVYVNGGWDDRDFMKQFSEKGNIALADLHASVKE